MDRLSSSLIPCTTQFRSSTPCRMKLSLWCWCYVWLDCWFVWAKSQFLCDPSGFSVRGHLRRSVGRRSQRDMRLRLPRCYLPAPGWWRCNGLGISKASFRCIFMQITEIRRKEQLGEQSDMFSNKDNNTSFEHRISTNYYRNGCPRDFCHWGHKSNSFANAEDTISYPVVHIFSLLSFLELCCYQRGCTIFQYMQLVSSDAAQVRGHTSRYSDWSRTIILSDI